MDKPLIDLAKQAIAARTRRYANVADVLAIIERESHGATCFNRTEAQYKANLHAAVHLTGLMEADIIKAATIDNGPLKGQIGKFRCEPGYWTWALGLKFKFSRTDRFLLSCSFGLGQKMMRWLVTGTPQEDWIGIIKHFAGSPPTQALYVAGDIDSLLTGANGDRALAYTRYNAGPALHHATEYGTTVSERYKQIKTLLELEHDIS